MTVFSVWNVLCVVMRMASNILAVLTFWFGLPTNEDAGTLDTLTGNYNTATFRILGLALVFVVQVPFLHLSNPFKTIQDQVTPSRTKSFNLIHSVLETLAKIGKNRRI